MNHRGGQANALNKKVGHIMYKHAHRHYRLNEYYASPEGVLRFLNSSGLLPLFQDKTIQSLVDYALGVEVGLSSNGRKNRAGDLAEAVIASKLTSHHIAYQAQIKSTNLAHLFVGDGVDQKVFDFVIATPKTTYLVEVNFYNSNGSKLNETARSFTNLEEKIKQSPDYTFVWITDGPAWHGAKNKLEEAYHKIEHVYNLASLDAFLAQIAHEQQTLA
jgi:type II restriction enzyme